MTKITTSKEIDEAIFILKRGNDCNGNCELCNECTEVKYQQAVNTAIKALEQVRAKTETAKA